MQVPASVVLARAVTTTKYSTKEALANGTSLIPVEVFGVFCLVAAVFAVITFFLCNQRTTRQLQEHAAGRLWTRVGMHEEEEEEEADWRPATLHRLHDWPMEQELTELRAVSSSRSNSNSNTQRTPRQEQGMNFGSPGSQASPTNGLKNGYSTQDYRMAIKNFEPRQPDELQIRKGDRLRVVKEYNDGWVKATLAGSDVVGMVPANRLRPKGDEPPMPR